MPYQPIENYGLIGNLRTAALVGMDGSIDWLCLPRFDSPSVFATFLDDNKGGRFPLAPPGEGYSRKQHYWPNTNILLTRFWHPDGIGEVVDYMPVVGAESSPGDQLVRRVRKVAAADVDPPAATRQPERNGTADEAGAAEDERAIHAVEPTVTGNNGDMRECAGRRQSPPSRRLLGVARELV